MELEEWVVEGRRYHGGGTILGESGVGFKARSNIQKVVA
jgi:hypothetical protein